MKSNTTIFTIAILAALTLCTANLFAATINWNVFDITNTSNPTADVSTDGDLVYANSGGNIGSNFTVNSVTFSGGQLLDSQDKYDNLSTRVTGLSDGTYQAMLRSAARSFAGANTITLSVLPSATYQVQIWVSDTANIGNGVYVDGGAAIIEYQSAAEGAWGQYALGTFYSDSTEQVIALQRYNNLAGTPTPAGNLEINNIQLRLLNIPEPSTAILAGLGLAGLCLRRRRR